MFFILFFINIILYLTLLKFFLFLLGNKYIFPLRLAELLNFIINVILNLTISFFILGPDTLINILIINIGLFFISYSICSMIATSPRTKILLDLYKFKKINKKKYLKKVYNEEIILNNRINRLLTNNEIIYKKKKFISINKKGFKLFSIVTFFFYLMKII